MFLSRTCKLLSFSILIASITAPTVTWAQQKTTVRFSSNNDNASVEGVIKGNQYHDYVLGAKAGQRMGVSLITKGGAFFNILPPGSNDLAIYNSSINGNDAVNVSLAKSGNYTIRVYLMGDAKDASKTVSYMVSTVIMK